MNGLVGSKRETTIVTVHQHRLSIQGWLALLALILAARFIIDNLGMLLELTWILFGAFILSVMLRPLADLFARWQIPRGITVMVAYSLLLLGIYATLRLIIPVVGVEAASLRQAMPTITGDVMRQIGTMSMAKWLPSTASLAQEVNNQFDTIFLGALSTVTGLGTLLLNLFVLLIVAYFFVTISLHSEHQIWLWLNPIHRSHLRTIFYNSYRRLNRWVWIQLIFGLYHAVAFVLGLLYLQVPFALTIGLLGGFLSLIPYLGVIMATVLAALSVLPTSPWLALWVVLFMTSVTLIGSHVLMPLLFGRAVGLNTLVVLIALFVGAQLQGIVGMIFAIPIAVIIDTVSQEMILPPSAVLAQEEPAAVSGSTEEANAPHA